MMNDRMDVGAGAGGGLGCFGFLVMLIAGYVMFVNTTGDPRDLTYASGTRPQTAVEIHANEHGGSTDFDYAWDVRRRVETTFSVPIRLGGGRSASLEGDLHVEVPEGCADRTIHWEARADGTRIGSGRLKWLRTYDLETGLETEGIPARIRLSAWWDGGTEVCPSFALTWSDPRVRPSVDYNLLD
ncbi:hypothetical protein [Streptomyces ureilyticus]|uniref:DUF2207 domain-containing protein n=1 Tax=Streptomyces ureilyticus TaxID=1775131 RepID=A0ABX0DS84_9ACTN|nr:hypothetical protein [Streptomyces ureilyticus]NGO43619.1 hypothetical protein [Streptomyces ureilyticus]